MSDEGDRIGEATWYLDAGRPHDALVALSGNDPYDPRAAYIRGRALIEIGRIAEGEEVARHALAEEPENIFLLELLASAQLASNAAAAEETLRSAMAVEPENHRVLGLYVIVLLQQGRIEAAERMLERLMRAAPQHEATHRIRAMFMLRARSEGGLAAAQQFLTQYPDDGYAHYLQGLAYLRERWWRGLRHLREAAALSPHDPVIVETARVLTAWYAWPAHLTSGATYSALILLIACWMVVGSTFVNDDAFLHGLVAMVLLNIFRWTAYLGLNSLLRRRATRALHKMYGRVP